MFSAAIRSAKLKADASTDYQDVKQYFIYRMLNLKTNEGAAMAEARGAPRRVVEWLKTASPATMSTSTSSPFALALDRFLGANQPRGAFDSMKADMLQVPLLTRVVLQSGVIVADEVAEGQPKPVRRLNLSNLDTEASKFVAQIVLSLETLQAAPGLAASMIAAALPQAVSRAVDSYFLGKVEAQEIGESSSEINPSWSLVLNDIEELLRNVRTGENSRLWLILTPRACKYLSRLATENAVTTLGWNGGELMGINVIASEAQGSNRLTLADATAIVYGDNGTEIRTSDQAAIEMLDNPTNASGPSVTATSLVSPWQTNCRVLLAERRISVRVVDTDAIATLSGAQWGIGADSPAMP
jgi:hypothetical protein